MSIRKRAFTLIELLVVVAIIAVLIAILLPSLGKAKDRAKTAACSSNIKALYGAVMNYATEYDGTIMPSRTQTGSSQSFMWCGVDVLGPELGLNRNAGASQTTQFQRVQQLIHCPSQQINPDAALVAAGTTLGVVSDYTYNQNMGDPFGTQVNNLPKFPCLKISGLRPDLFLITELHPYQERGKNDYSYDNVDRLLTLQSPPITPTTVPPPWAAPRTPAAPRPISSSSMAASSSTSSVSSPTPPHRPRRTPAPAPTPTPRIT